MTLWLILTAMISAAAVLVSAPFIRRMERLRLQSAGNLAVYRDQLKEVEGELARGVIDGAQAEGASIEIKRRILAVARAEDSEHSSGIPLSRPERNFAVASVTAIVVFGSILLYALVGSPELPAASPGRANATQPVAVAPVVAPAVPPSLSTQAATRPQAAPAAQPGASGAASQTALPPVEEMVERLQAKLQRNAKDPEGWRMLGWSYFSLERFAEAADAYAKAIELRPGAADYHAARGEALVRGADGVVNADASKEFDEAIRLDPKEPRARFYAGLAKEQAGDKQAALADWTAVLADADPTESWVPELKQRMADLRKDLGEATPPPAAAPSTDSAGALRDFLRAEKAKPKAADEVSRGPSAEDVRKAQGMAPQDRTAMIRGMVDNLASRLDQSPDDAEGWIKLIRSRVVLGETELAKQSLSRALGFFNEQRPERGRIVEAARQLGIEP